MMYMVLLLVFLGAFSGASKVGLDDIPAEFLIALGTTAWFYTEYFSGG